VMSKSSQGIFILLYDGQCPFCRKSVQILKGMDFLKTLTYVDLHEVRDFKALHPQLTKELVLSQLYLLEPNGKMYGGFDVFRRVCFLMPILYPAILILYFPGMKWIGPFVYRLIAKNRF